MTDSNTIYADFYKIDSNDTSGIIKFYENNALILDNKTVFQDKDDFNEYIIILCKYVISLEKIGKYTKAVKYAEKAVNLIDYKLSEYNINLKDFTKYWSMLSSKARAHYNLKDYKNSILTFKKLHLWDPDNDNIKNWLDSAQSRQRNSINIYFYVTGLILLFGEMIFGNKFGNPELKLYMSVISFIFLSVGLINEYFGDKLVKLIRKK